MSVIARYAGFVATKTAMKQHFAVAQHARSSVARYVHL